MITMRQEELMGILSGNFREDMEVDISLVHPSSFDISKGVKPSVSFSPYDKIQDTIFVTEEEYEITIRVKRKQEGVTDGRKTR